MVLPLLVAAILGASATFDVASVKQSRSILGRRADNIDRFGGDPNLSEPRHDRRAVGRRSKSGRADGDAVQRLHPAEVARAS